MLTMMEYLNQADKVAIGCQLVAALVLLSFVFFVLYFTLVVGPHMVAQNQVKRRQHHEDLIERVHLVFKSHHKTRSKRILESLTIQKLASEEANRVIEKSKSNHLRLKERVSTTNRNKVSDYRLYAPLYSGYRSISRLALL